MIKASGTLLPNLMPLTAPVSLEGSLLPVLLAVLLLALAIVLVLLIRLSARLAARRVQEQLLQAEINRLNQDISRQLSIFQDTLFSRVADNGRDQREINALFMGQLQQSSQGSSQTLDSIRQSVQDQLGRIAGHLRDMQLIAGDVRSLRQVLSNVRGRGIVGELQLERLLQDILAPGQFVSQMRLKPGSQEAVDFVIRLNSDTGQEDLYLPVDAKFPLDYLNRLIAAREAGDDESAAVFSRELTTRIRQEARKISERYIMPPVTTDFALLYLPSETLFGEAVHDGSLCDDIYRQYRVLLAGPASMAAILAGLQAIVRLQAMERQSVAISRSLAVLQKDFKHYEDSLGRVQNRLRKAVADTDTCLGHASQIRRHLDGLDLEEWVQDTTIRPYESAGEEHEDGFNQDS